MYWPVILFVVFISGVHSQLTAQSSVAPELRECYSDTHLVNRNNLPPTTINVLIDIIRTIEDNPNVNLDLRQLAVLILHTYRQDGIEYHAPNSNAGFSSNVLPYAPTFHSYPRHRLLLTRILPNNLQVLANDTLSSQLKCAMHAMLSTTVDARVRGDEMNCNQLSQYRALRTPRQATNIEDDVEVLDQATVNLANKIGHLINHNPNDDVEYNGNGGVQSERQLLGDSSCPILGGVVSTQWGAVSAGHLIAGIAAGAELQQIPVLQLTKGSVLNVQNIQQYVTSIYPATLSGDIAEAVLIQGTALGNPSISIGAVGSWNSTEAVRNYMLHSRINLEMTDPEIRGDIDGFVLGSNLNSVLGTFSTMKLSQLLDMYYSTRNGVFNPLLRACNRRVLASSTIDTTRLISETHTFAAALDTNIQLPGTIVNGLDEFVTSAVNNFQTYTANNLNDLSCTTTDTTSLNYRLKTNLIIALDATWQYQTIYPAISYLLDTIEVSKFGSSVTLLNALNGDIIVNKTFSISEFHANYTLLAHQSLMTGVSLQTTFTTVSEMMHNELEHEKTTNYVGGNSTVLLFLLNSGNLQNNEVVQAQARILNETVPDLRILFATATNQFDVLWSLVRDMNNDIKTISLTSQGTNVKSTMDPILARIESAGRRVVNSNCGSEYPPDTGSGTRQFEDIVEPGFVNFYSISPNYFYESNENRKIRITRNAGGVGSLVICHSRSVAQPRQNSTVAEVENAVTCETLTTTGNIEISLQDACDGFWTINSCPFFYFSVESRVDATITAFTATCTDNHCRFPYSLRYQVQIEEFGCFSSAGGLGASLIVVLTALLVALPRM